MLFCSAPAIEIGYRGMNKFGYPYFVIDFAFLRQYVTLLQNRIS